VAINTSLAETQAADNCNVEVTVEMTVIRVGVGIATVVPSGDNPMVTGVNSIGNGLSLSDVSINNKSNNVVLPFNQAGDSLCIMR
jgi:hypothetical protein